MLIVNQDVSCYQMECIGSNACQEEDYYLLHISEKGNCKGSYLLLNYNYYLLCIWSKILRQPPTGLTLDKSTSLAYMQLWLTSEMLQAYHLCSIDDKISLNESRPLQWEHHRSISMTIYHF